MNHELYALREKNGAAVKASKEPRYITDLARNDVLLGRGAFAINYVGNVLFREMCRERRDEYNTVNRRSRKTQIAKEVLSDVFANQGRFLRPVETSEEQEAHSCGVPAGTKIWLIVDAKKALDKVKQSIRERDYLPKSSPSLSATSSSIRGSSWCLTQNSSDCSIQETIEEDNSMLPQRVTDYPKLEKAVAARSYLNGNTMKDAATPRAQEKFKAGFQPATKAVQTVGQIIQQVSSHDWLSFCRTHQKSDASTELPGEFSLLSASSQDLYRQYYDEGLRQQAIQRALQQCHDMSQQQPSIEFRSFASQSSGERNDHQAHMPCASQIFSSAMVSEIVSPMGFNVGNGNLAVEHIQAVLAHLAANQLT